MLSLLSCILTQFILNMPPNLIIMVENRNNLNNKIVLCYLNAILLYSNTMTKAGHFKIVRKPEVMIPTIVL